MQNTKYMIMLSVTEEDLVWYTDVFTKNLASRLLLKLSVLNFCEKKV